MEAKSFIADLDFFVGDRMHATIAALSTGVPVVPASYSRKFEGLFGSVDYNYIIHGREDDTDSAIMNTEKWFLDREILKQSAACSMGIANRKLQLFIEGLKKYMK